MVQQKFNKLANKHVLIIGGTAGIGHGVAEACVESGAKVTVSSSSTARVESAVASLRSAYTGSSSKIFGLVCDLSQPTVEQDLEKLFRDAEKTAGIVNHVVLTAANKPALGALQDVDIQQVQAAAHMRMNVPILLAKVAARHLPKSRESSFILTSGIVAARPLPGWPVVAFLGAGLQGLARGLAVDLQPIRVNAVEPGFVDTPLWDDMSPQAREGLMKAQSEKALTKSVGLAEDVAEAYIWLLKDSNATGTVARTDSGGTLV